MKKNTYSILILSGDSSIASNVEGPFYDMLKELSQYWDRIDIICPAPKKVERIKVFSNVFLHPTSPSFLRHVLTLPALASQVISKYRPDLIISHDFGLFHNGWTALYLNHKYKIPYISEILHIEGYPIATSWKERLFRFIAPLYIKIASKKVVGVRVINKSEIPPLLKHYGVEDKQIHYLPAQLIDTTIFYPKETKKKYDLLFVGRLSTNKGLFTFLNAVKQLSSDRPINVCIIGKGPLEKDMKGFLHKERLTEVVEYIPYLQTREELTQKYREAKMLVCSSTAEGGPRVTIEAMACGTPVISTPVGIMPDIIEDGENGMLFKWDIKELVNKATQVIDDEAIRRTLSQHGITTAQEFEVKKVIRNYAHKYQEIIDESVLARNEAISN